MLESDTWNGKNENIIKYWVYPGNIVRGFPGSSTGKESACNGGDPALIPGLGRSSEERMGYPLQYSWASLVAQLVKESAFSVGRSGFNSWVGKLPWRRIWQSTPALLPGKSHGQRSLIGYSPWGRKESDTTEQLHFHFLSQVRKTIHKGIQ